MHSIVYATVKIVVEHPAGEDPCDVVNDADYHFNVDNENGKITDTEIKEVENRGEMDPATGAIKS